MGTDLPLRPPSPAAVLGPLVRLAGGAPRDHAAVARVRSRRPRLGGPVSRFVSSVLSGTLPPGVRVHDTVTDTGTPLRVYTPVVPPGRVLGVVVHFHGGGFVFGEADDPPWWFARVAADVPAVVVWVGYRLAPEHPFPAGLDDCVAAVRWVARHPEHIGRLARVDVTRLALMGDSAGGNLAAGVALALRDEPEPGDPRLVHQVLVYPATDATLGSASVTEDGTGVFLSRADLEAFYRLYTRDASGGALVEPDDPRVSPLLAHSHAELPAATVLAAERDPLRDDATRYAAALAAHDVPTRLTVYPGAVHGFLSFPGIEPVRARHAVTEIAGSLRAGGLDPSTG